MLSKRGLVYLVLMPILFGCSGNKNQNVVIIFENQPTLKKAQELVFSLPTNSTSLNTFFYVLYCIVGASN